MTDTFTFFHMGGKMTRFSWGRLFLGWWVSFCREKNQLKTTKQVLPSYLMEILELLGLFSCFL